MAARIRGELKGISEGRWEEKLVAIELIDPKNLFHFRGIVISPPGAPTSGYLFFLDIEVPRLSYPFEPPKIRAVQDIWHPKFTFGRSPRNSICLEALNRSGWEPHFTLETVLITIQQLLVDLGDVEKTDVLNDEAYQQYVSNKEGYNKTARECAKQDNAGYGMVQFEDYRLSAIRSILRSCFGKIEHIYEATVLCRKETAHIYRLEVVVTPTFEIYRQNVKSKFASSYQKITSFEFDFECSMAAVDIGDSLSIDKCWKITAIMESTVCRKDVIEMDPRKDIPPHCTMTVEWLRPKRQPVRLIHDMAIRDSESRKNIRPFQVCVDPKAFIAQPLDMDSRPTLPKLLTGIPVKNLCFRIRIHEEIGENYFDFGVHLLEDKTGMRISNIRSEMRGSPIDINREILMQWLEGRGKPVVWKTIVDVLHEIELNELAKAVEEHFM